MEKRTIGLKKLAFLRGRKGKKVSADMQHVGIQPAKDGEEIKLTLDNLRLVRCRKLSEIVCDIERDVPDGFDQSIWDREIFEFCVINQDEDKIVLVAQIDDKIVRPLADALEVLKCGSFTNYPVKFSKEGYALINSNFNFREKVFLEGMSISELKNLNKEVIYNQYKFAIDSYLEDCASQKVARNKQSEKFLDNLFNM